MTKAELREYRYYRKELHQLADERRLLYTRAERSTRSPDKAPTHGGENDPYPAIMDKLSTIEKMENEIKAKLMDFEKAIRPLSSRERYLMRLYYMQAKEWFDIMDEMHYSWSHIHRIHASALKKMG